MSLLRVVCRRRETRTRRPVGGSAGRGGRRPWARRCHPCPAELRECCSARARRVPARPAGVGAVSLRLPTVSLVVREEAGATGSFCSREREILRAESPGAGGRRWKRETGGAAYHLFCRCAWNGVASFTLSGGMHPCPVGAARRGWAAGAPGLAREPSARSTSSPSRRVPGLPRRRRCVCVSRKEPHEAATESSTDPCSTGAGAWSPPGRTGTEPSRTLCGWSREQMLEASAEAGLLRPPHLGEGGGESSFVCLFHYLPSSRS